MEKSMVQRIERRGMGACGFGATANGMRASWMLPLLAGTMAGLGLSQPTLLKAEEATPPAAGESEGEAEAPASEHLIPGLADWRQNLAARGFEFTVEYIGEGVFNVSGGLKRSGVYEGLLKAGIDLDWEKILGWKGATFHASAHYAHGESPSGKLLGDVLTLSNLDAYDSVHLFEVWLQQELWDGKISIRAGQLAADEEFAGTDYGGLFTHGTTGWPGIIALNAPTPAYPSAAPGVRLELKPTEFSFVRAGVFDGNPDPGDADGNPLNVHGTRFNLSEGAFIISEAGYQWNQGVSKDKKLLPGQFKLGGWYHTDHFDDARMDDGGLSLADPGSSGVPARHRGNWGLYGAVEQLVYREDAESTQGAGLFTRLGWGPEERSFLKYYVEGGVHYQGLIPGRDDDVFGVAASYGRVSSPVRGLVEDSNALNATSDPLPDYELAIQATYQVAVRPGWTLQPTLWWILHPGGSHAIHDSLLLGLRSSFDF